MSFIEDLQSLDTSDPGRWPLAFRAIAVVLVLLGVSGGGIYMFVINEEKPLLERAEREEQEQSKPHASSYREEGRARSDEVGRGKGKGGPHAARRPRRTELT